MSEERPEYCTKCDTPEVLCMCKEEHNWNNVLDKLPEDAQEVLVIHNKSVQFSVHFYGTKEQSIWFSKDLQTYFENIEWWMLIPELPETV